MTRSNRKNNPARTPTWEGMHALDTRGSNFNQAQYLNDATEWLYYNWLLQLAMARFEWQDLPPEIDSRFLELALHEFGLVGFFWLEEYGKYFALQAAPAGNINAYRNPTGFRVYGYGDSPLNRHLSAKQCVPIWHNLIRCPEASALMLFARKLASITRAHDVQVNNQKAPIIITCNETQKLTMKNLIEQWMGNQPIIFADDLSIAGTEIKYMTPEPKPDYNGGKLLEDRAMVWAEAMNYLGISNSDIRKAERVQSAEVQANDGQTEQSGLITLTARRQACEEINRRYGLSVWCDMATDYSSRNFAALMSAPAIEYGVVGDDEI